MSARVKPCPDCGGGTVTAQAPNGGRVRLEPYPAPDGPYRVDVLDRGLMLLGPAEASSARTKRWERHRCVTAAKAVPRGGGPAQLDLFGSGA